jgi:hypothetical protein
MIASRRSVALAAIVLVFGALPGRAQGTALVPSTDLAYADVDRLSELGLLDAVIIGQRPYSRREMARIARIADERINKPGRSDAPPYAQALIRRLRERFGDADAPKGDVTLLPLDGASLTALTTDAERRGFPSLGTKQTEATIDPLAERRLGEPAVRGSTLSLEISQRLEASDWFAIQARERFEARSPSDPSVSSTNGELLLGSMRARFGNVAISAGREQTTWAQGAGDGLILASDAPALDQITIAGDHPFMLPGFLRRLGPTQATLLFADLGPSVQRSHSKLVAYKVSIAPTSALELGAFFENHFGGAGGRSSSLGDRLVDLVWFVDVFRHHNYTDSTKTLDVESDKVIGGDGRLRIASLGGLVVTGELLMDDFDVHRIPQLLTGYGSQTLGLAWPVFISPEMSLKLTAKHMGIITYTHSQLADGMTTRGRLLGDELGPDAKSYDAQIGWMPSSSMRLDLEGRSAQYSKAEYGSFYPDPGSSKYVVQKISSAPNELRDLALASLTLQDASGLAVIVRVGGEHIRNADFLGGHRYDYVAQVAIRIGQ